MLNFEHIIFFYFFFIIIKFCFPCVSFTVYVKFPLFLWLDKFSLCLLILLLLAISLRFIPCSMFLILSPLSLTTSQWNNQTRKFGYTNKNVNVTGCMLDSRSWILTWNYVYSTQNTHTEIHYFSVIFILIFMSEM